MICWYILVVFDHDRNIKAINHIPELFVIPFTGKMLNSCPTIAEKIWNQFFVLVMIHYNLKKSIHHKIQWWAIWKKKKWMVLNDLVGVLHCLHQPNTSLGDIYYLYVKLCAFINKFSNQQWSAIKDQNLSFWTGLNGPLSV